MKDWLAKLAEQPKTAEQALQETLQSLSPEELRSLSYDLGVTERPSYIDEMQVKIAHAQRMGTELAQEHDMQKEALLPLVGRTIGGLAANAVKDKMVSTAGNAISNAVGSGGGGGAFSYGGKGASVKSAGVLNKAVGGGFSGLAQRAAGYAVRNPGAALTAAGAVGGAIMAPRDPQTGEKQYLRGAMMGGGLAAGANALTQGGIANKMRSAVMNRENPVLGQGARKYLMDSARATKGQYAKKPATRGGGSTPPPSSGHTSGPLPTATAVSGAESVGQAAENIPDMTAHARTAPPMPPKRVPRVSDNAVLSEGMLGRTNRSTPTPIPTNQDPLARFEGNDALVAQPSAITPEKRRLFSPRQQMPMSPVSMGTPHMEGPVSGVPSLSKSAALRAVIEKKANRQTLVYDPATKTFTRQHLTPSTGGDSVAGTGAAPIAAGHTEPVRAHGITHMGEHPYGSREFAEARMRQAGLRQPPSPIASSHAPGAEAVTGAHRTVSRGPVSMGASAAKATSRPALGGLAAAMAKRASAR